MIGPLFNLGAGAAQAGYGLYQENQAKKKLAQADAMASGPIRSQAARNRIARQESDSQSAIDSALRSQATQALQISNTGGSRALQAATPALLRATEMTTGRALDRLGSLGARTGRLEDKINLQTSNAGVVDNRNRLNQAADAARTAASPRPRSSSTVWARGLSAAATAASTDGLLFARGPSADGTTRGAKLPIHPVVTTP